MAKARKKTPAIQLVVRRGALRRFHKMKRKAAKLPVKVVWDRRQDERRAASGEVEGDRRRAERRQKPPFTWDLADFVVVGNSNAGSPARQPRWGASAAARRRQKRSTPKQR